MQRFSRCVWVVALALLSGVPGSRAQTVAGSGRSEAATLLPPVELENLGTLKLQLRLYHDGRCSCGSYMKDFEMQTERAQAALHERVTHKRAGERLALVLDIDETALSNWHELASSDFGFNAAADAVWMQSEKAPALPGTLALYQQAQAAGLAVFFIAGRKDTLRAVTAENLQQQGYLHWDGLVLRSPEEYAMTAVDYKSRERQKIAAAGYSMVMSVGDQMSDLDGEPRAEISVKLPNPFYYIP